MVTLLAALSRGVRAAWPFLQAGVREGLPANRIIAAVRAGGYPVRRQDALTAIRYIKEGQPARDYLRLLPKGNVINPSLLQEAATPIKANYTYAVRLQVQFPDDEKLYEKWRWITSDHLRTPGEVEALAAEDWAGYDPLSAGTLVSAAIYDAKVRTPIGSTG